MNIYGVLKQEIAAHPKEKPHDVEQDVISAYKRAGTEFAGKWRTRGEVLFWGGAAAFLATYNPAVEIPALGAQVAGLGMKIVPPIMVRRDTAQQVADGHLKPDAPDSRFANRTSELLHHTLH